MTDGDLQPSAKTLVISYGVTSRSAKDAVKLARKKGHNVSFLGVLSLFPVPQKKIAEALKGVETVIVAEENLRGLYRSMVETLCRGKKVIAVNKIGSMITPLEIYAAILRKNSEQGTQTPLLNDKTTKNGCLNRRP